jgi:N-acetyl-gamma-glutamylphosphate reductase
MKRNRILITSVIDNLVKASGQAVQNEFDVWLEESRIASKAKWF